MNLESMKDILLNYFQDSQLKPIRSIPYNSLRNQTLIILFSENMGFEPMKKKSSTKFKLVALNHSANSLIC